MASDASLLAAARDNPDAFRELYDRYAEAVHRYFVRRTGSRTAALDLTAETLAQAWRVRARVRDEANGSAAPWICGIAGPVTCARGPGATTPVRVLVGASGTETIAAGRPPATPARAAAAWITARREVTAPRAAPAGGALVIRRGAARRSQGGPGRVRRDGEGYGTARWLRSRS